MTTDTITEYFEAYRAKHDEAFWAERDEELKRKAIAEHDEAMVILQSRITKASDPVFRATDTSDARFNVQGWEKVRDWEPTPERPWLGLIGETGTCKSRMAHLIAKRIITEMAKGARRCFELPTFYYTQSTELCDLVTVTSTGSFEQKHEAREKLGRIRAAKFLLVDDLGKGRVSPSVAQELFGLVDHRYRHQLPMIWTANSAPDRLGAMMNGDVGPPFAGRLNDSSRIVRLT
jgi:DNA replication protein DnaC